MSYSLKYASVIAFFLISLSNHGYCQNPTIVSGSFKGLNEGDKVYLTSNKKSRDSASIKDGKFRFNDFYPKEKAIYFIHVKYASGRYDFPLFISDNSYLVFEVNREFNQFKISGDKDSNEQNDFYQGMVNLYTQKKLVEKEIAGVKDSAGLFELRQNLNDIGKKINDYPYNWVNAHRSSGFSVAVIRLFIAKNTNSGVEDTVAEKYYDGLLPEARANNEEVENLERGFAYYNDKYSRLAVGSTIVNFKVRDTSGIEIKLADFNQYVLVDFWASWCGPCRANNPLLKEIYNSYKEKGLVVLSISMDEDIEKWKSAIKKDDMKWMQGSDLKGQFAGLGGQYQINAVPIYILVSPDKKIILKSIGGDVDLIKEKLNEIYKL